ncbi:MAG: LacI family DNA-binding transcriptional regulator [Actinomycetota bacterium]|nr:LacI family DNA-binding transcriptional regulator [Actinomycetota bacterium]
MAIEEKSRVSFERPNSVKSTRVSSNQPIMTTSSNATIYDVASRAGVSIATVSRVLNGYSQMKPATRDLVLSAMRDLRFVPNNSARGLSSGTKMILGMVFLHSEAVDPDLEVEEDTLLFTDAVIRGAEEAASKSGYSLLLGGIGKQRQTETLDRMYSNCDGVVLLDRTIPDRQVPTIAKRLPTVLLAGNGKSRSATTIRVDNEEPMKQLARHLTSVHGYSDFAFMAGIRTSPDSTARESSFRDEVEALGGRVETDSLWESNYTTSGAIAVIEERLKLERSMPQAIVCANDQSAVGVIYALEHHGFKVPQDVAVTGFDDISLSRRITPSLTTVRQPFQDLGSVAVEALIRICQGEVKSGAGSKVLPTEVIYRSSCGCEGVSESRVEKFMRGRG